eukprot:scaffold1098_cov417-Prasinococcus_capsulatus_cf.AAC.10
MGTLMQQLQKSESELRSEVDGLRGILKERDLQAVSHHEQDTTELDALRRRLEESDWSVSALKSSLVAARVELSVMKDLQTVHHKEEEAIRTPSARKKKQQQHFQQHQERLDGVISRLQFTTGESLSASHSQTLGTSILVAGHGGVSSRVVGNLGWSHDEPL